MLEFLAMALAVAALGASVAHAQSQPYGPLEDRPIQALSADEVASLEAGRGMGMALPAELNRYPGPAHVLENAAALGLTPEQRAAVSGQFAAMHSEAVALGELVIAKEVALDALFKSGGADAGSIDYLTNELGGLYGKLRAVHLRTHLATKATLTETQLAMYETRGAMTRTARHLPPCTSTSGDSCVDLGVRPQARPSAGLQCRHYSP